MDLFPDLGGVGDDGWGVMVLMGVLMDMGNVLRA